MEIAIKQVRGTQKSNLLACLGGPGSGKSTLMASMAYGRNKMILKKYQLLLGKQRNSRDFIDCTDPNSVFKIGHSNFISETFIPKSQYDDKTGLTYADMASLNSQDGGSFIEIVNNFLISHLFAKTRRVRFVIPITFEEVMEGRGNALKNQLDKIIKITDCDLG